MKRVIQLFVMIALSATVHAQVLDFASNCYAKDNIEVSVQLLVYHSKRSAGGWIVNEDRAVKNRHVYSVVTEWVCDYGRREKKSRRPERCQIDTTTRDNNLMHPYFRDSTSPQDVVECFLKLDGDVREGLRKFGIYE